MNSDPIDFEGNRVQAFFYHLAAKIGPHPDTVAVCVAHMVPNSVHFLPAVDAVCSVKAVLPKPKSVGRPEFDAIKRKFRTQALSREWAADAPLVASFLGAVCPADSKLVLVDIGGYFANSLTDIVKHFRGKLAGVMEGTENGAQKYEAAMRDQGGPYSVPVVTVARSPLKLPEDYLVGSSVVFSIEAILREQAQILQTRTACVVGYGRVGSAVASVLRGRGIPVAIHDHDPTRMAEAAARGYQVYRRLDAALAISSLVVCATGNRALDKYGFAALRPGSLVASVTSADDELDLDALITNYRKPVRISPHLERYDEEGTHRYFWLLNEGNAANFVHGAVIGPAIQLIEGEKLAAIGALARGELSPSDTLAELDSNKRRAVAEIWNEHFLED